MNGVAECSRANSSRRAAVSAGIGTARRRAAREEYVLAAPGSSSGSGSGVSAWRQYVRSASDDGSVAALTTMNCGASPWMGRPW
ncbi:Uncharacterised protein [Mycobacteroides abscessus subsp. abscessus]|nr:Uncharacterised protein [Mycobacteroides abscessus subsp. abscessus]